MSASLDWSGMLWGLQEVGHTAKSRTLCHPLFRALAFAVEILEEYQMGWFSSLVIVLSADTFCGQWLFSGLSFSLHLLLWCGVWCWGAAAFCHREAVEILPWLHGLVTADEIKQQSDPVTTLSHILLACFAWPTLFLALCSSPGLFYIDRLTVFSPSLSFPCSVWGFSTWMFAKGGKQTTFFWVQGLRDIERFLREQCGVGWGENFYKTSLPFCTNLGAESFRLQ